MLSDLMFLFVLVIRNLIDRFKRVERCHDTIVLITVQQPRECLSVGFDIRFSLYYLQRYLCLVSLIWTFPSGLVFIVQQDLSGHLGSSDDEVQWCVYVYCRPQGGRDKALIHGVRICVTKTSIQLLYYIWAPVIRCV